MSMFGLLNTLCLAVAANGSGVNGAIIGIVVVVMIALLLVATLIIVIVVKKPR